MIHWRLGLIIGLLSLTASLAATGSASASILIAQVPTAQSETFAFSADFEGGMGASSASPVSIHNTETEPANSDNDRLIESLLPFQTSSGGATSGAATSSSGPNASPIHSVAAVPLSDPQLITWIGSEQRFTLLMPPGNELLRPPQTQLRSL